MKDANGVAGPPPGPGAGGRAQGHSVVRHDAGPKKKGNDAEPLAGARENDLPAWSARVERGWWIALAVVMLVFSGFPIANLVLGLSTKDYNLWYQVGLALRQGLDIYPRPETHRLFPFMYPPSAAAMLAWVSMLGATGSLLALVAVNSASWLASIGLSVWLSVKPGKRWHPLVVILPSLFIIVLVHNVYLLGQPNLLLLALLLGAFACLRLGRPISAGTLVATAAAIKAFPILVLGYLVYRRMWTASAATVAVLAAWLLIAPLPFRTPHQAVDDLVVWSKGMVFTYNSYGIAQRPFRSYSYKNQSIMALAHRLLRDVPADGEAVLSHKRRADNSGPRQQRAGQPPIDPSTDLLSFLKPHPQQTATRENSSGADAATLPIASDTKSAESAGIAGRPSRWDDVLDGAEPALRAAWRVNIVAWSFRTVTIATLLAMSALCLFVVAVLPPAKVRTRETDALEFALVTLLTTMFSPLSFNYAYVWLIYPATLGLHRVISEPAGAPWHRLKIGWIVAVFLLPALALPMPLLAQAYGNLFLPALLLVIGLGVMLRAAARNGSDQIAVQASHRAHHDQFARSSSLSVDG
jgi:alpha-1,2-mannosyltransferase